MNNVSVNTLLGIYSAIMTFFTFISVFFTFPAIHKINDIEPRVCVVEHVTQGQSKQYALLSAKIDAIQKVLAGVAVDVQWTKDELRNNRDHKKRYPK